MLGLLLALHGSFVAPPAAARSVGSRAAVPLMAAGPCLIKVSSQLTPVK